MNLVNYTSISIFIPAIIAILLNRWIDAIIISTLGCASVTHHFNNKKITLIIDRLALICLIIRTFLLAIQSYYTIALYLIGFGYMFIIYTYGFYNNCFSFDPRFIVADRYHSSMHIIGIIIYSVSMIWFL